MKRILGSLVAVAAFMSMTVAAQASIVYTKGSKIYTASNAGKGAKQIATGDVALISQDGRFVFYSNSTDALLRVPVAGGAPTQFGGAAKWCVKCTVVPSPNGESVLIIGAQSELDYVPVIGAPVRLAPKIDIWASFSPDSKQIAYDQESPDTYSVFTTPVTSALPTKLNIGFASIPVWTNAGIVAGTIATVGNKPQFRIVLLDAAGNIKRVLQRKTIKSAKQLKKGYDIQDPTWPAGSNVVTTSYGRKSTETYSLIGTSNGKILAQRTFKKNEAVWAASPDGKTLLVINKKGRLQSVNFKSGKRKTLVKSGVYSADIS